MNIWTLIGLLFISNFISYQIGKAVSELFHMRFQLCDMKILSKLYVQIWVEIIFGCVMTGIVYMNYFGAEYPKWFSITLGVVLYAIIMIFTDIKSYGKIVKAMNVLNIDTDEKLKQFIANNK